MSYPRDVKMVPVNEPAVHVNVADTTNQQALPVESTHAMPTTVSDEAVATGSGRPSEAHHGHHDAHDGSGAKGGNLLKEMFGATPAAQTGPWGEGDRPAQVNPGHSSTDVHRH